MWTILIIIAVIVLLVVWAVGLYNRLVRLRVETQQGWANIDVQLRRRYDLIPNLVETVKGYAAHERGVLEAVTKARTDAISAHGPADSGQANNALARALGGLFAVAENYPDLKASQNYLQLQTELATVEEMLAAARRYYNATVGKYNATQETVPTNVVANFGDFALAEFFEEDDDVVRAAPQVSFTA
ncbi:MAG: LemA family protein [Thermoleophilia bacterium]|nr:LemA family protein [Thermoleophilia bacterium]